MSSACNRFVSWYFHNSAQLAPKPWSEVLTLYVTRGAGGTGGIEFQDYVAIFALNADAVKSWCTALTQLASEQRASAAAKETDEKSPA